MSTRSLVAVLALTVLAAVVFTVVRPATSRAASPVPPSPEALDPGVEVRKIVLAGGCFWCMEPPFEKLDGVFDVVSGYIGGTVANPTYEQVSAGRTGHTEAVEISYDPAKLGYAQLLDLFWHNIDPLTPNAQFCDHGSQYRSEIFPSTPEERAVAFASRAAIAAQLNQEVVTEITDATTFYPAEDYHQDYYKKNPIRYQYYRSSCRRDARLKELWGDAAGVGTLRLLSTK